MIDNLMDFEKVAHFLLEEIEEPYRSKNIELVLKKQKELYFKRDNTNELRKGNDLCSYQVHLYELAYLECINAKSIFKKKKQYLKSEDSHSSFAEWLEKSYTNKTLKPLLRLAISQRYLELQNYKLIQRELADFEINISESSVKDHVYHDSPERISLSTIVELYSFLRMV